MYKISLRKLHLFSELKTSIYGLLSVKYLLTFDLLQDINRAYENFHAVVTFVDFVPEYKRVINSIFFCNVNT